MPEGDNACLFQSKTPTDQSMPVGDIDALGPKWMF